MSSYRISTLTFILVTLGVTLVLTSTFTSASQVSKQSRAKNAKRGCVYKGILRPPGSKFKPEPCTTCRCRKRTGAVHCVVKDCTSDRHCLKFSERKGGRCCPYCLELGCRHTDGKVYKRGAVIRNEPCVRCYCPLGGGEPVCDVTSCPLSQCVDPVHIQGVCCPVCPNGPNCQIGLLTLPINKTVEVEGATCTCERFTDQDGKTRVLARCNKDREEDEEDEDEEDDDEEEEDEEDDEEEEMD
ncbi:brorin-like protein [Elysia marginata]|uniref:Brorin-like protein n=1 Tax=Elysia marginata TaxID=1093978 RepID=A0AAV4H5M2_9GAST|nr:brorin-like protein [Elysia marginata]